MYPAKLKELRERIGLTRTEIAKIIGIDRSQYGHYENDYVTIPIKHLISLANYYKVSIDYILGLNTVKQYKKSIPQINNKISGERLKKLRKEYKLSQTDLANFLNTAFSTISSYERGINTIATNYLYALSKKYHISADYLLGRIDNPIYLKDND